MWAVAATRPTSASTEIAWFEAGSAFKWPPPGVFSPGVFVLQFSNIQRFHGVFSESWCLRRLRGQCLIKPAWRMSFAGTDAILPLASSGCGCSSNCLRQGQQFQMPSVRRLINPLQTQYIHKWGEGGVTVRTGVNFTASRVTKIGKRASVTYMDAGCEAAAVNLYTAENRILRWKCGSQLSDAIIKLHSDSDIEKKDAACSTSATNQRLLSFKKDVIL